MWSDLWRGTADALGLPEANLGEGEMALRAVVVYALSILFVRMGEKRLMGRNTPLDVILGIMLGSVLSRAITGNAPFFPAIVAGATLVLTHALFAILAFRLGWFAWLVNGASRRLIEDGAPRHDQLRKARLTPEDVSEGVRQAGGLERFEEVKLAVLERNGQISVVPRPKAPVVVDIAVQAGVQTVRVEIR